MILAILPLICCSTSVVKILQGKRSGNPLALAASGNKLTPTRSLSDESTEFVINKVGGAEDPVIEISPIVAPGKKLVAGSDRAVRIVTAGKRQRPWTVKKEGDAHKLAVGNMCLTLRGRVVKMERCRKNNSAQAFMITSEDEDSRECSDSSDCEHDHQKRRARRHVHYRPGAAEHRHYDSVPSEDAEYVRIVEDKVETVTDVVVKTSYETVTLHTTSTVTSTMGAADGDDRPPRSETGGADNRKNLKFPRSVIVRVHDDSGDEAFLDVGPAKARGEGADFVQNIVRAKRPRDTASESSTENGLEDLIKVFNGNNKHSGFIDIRAPRMFASKCGRASSKK